MSIKMSFSSAAVPPLAPPLAPPLVPGEDKLIQIISQKFNWTRPGGPYVETTAKFENTLSHVTSVRTDWIPIEDGMLITHEKYFKNVCAVKKGEGEGSYEFTFNTPVHPTSTGTLTITKRSFVIKYGDNSVTRFIGTGTEIVYEKWMGSHVWNDKGQRNLIFCGNRVMLGDVAMRGSNYTRTAATTAATTTTTSRPIPEAGLSYQQEMPTLGQGTAARDGLDMAAHRRKVASYQKAMEEDLEHVRTIPDHTRDAADHATQEAAVADIKMADHARKMNLNQMFG